MFTGIVAAVGRIESVRALTDGVRLVVHGGGLRLDDVAIGDSVALSGACMTVIAHDGERFEVDVSGESLARTVGLDVAGRRINLEKALRVGDPLGGHLVSGHVDGVGRVRALQARGESVEFVVEVDPLLGRFMAYKGSVAIDGVSLTVNRVEDSGQATRISMNLIPHTLSVTTLGTLQPQDLVNVEIDTLARYCERLLAHSGATLGPVPVATAGAL